MQDIFKFSPEIEALRETFREIDINRAYFLEMLHRQYQQQGGKGDNLVEMDMPMLKSIIPEISNAEIDRRQAVQRLRREFTELGILDVNVVNNYKVMFKINYQCNNEVKEARKQASEEKNEIQNLTVEGLATKALVISSENGFARKSLYNVLTSLVAKYAGDYDRLTPEIIGDYQFSFSQKKNARDIIRRKAKSMSKNQSKVNQFNYLLKDITIEEVEKYIPDMLAYYSTPREGHAYPKNHEDMSNTLGFWIMRQSTQYKNAVTKSQIKYRSKEKQKRDKKKGGFNKVEATKDPDLNLEVINLTNV